MLQPRCSKAVDDSVALAFGRHVVSLAPRGVSGEKPPDTDQREVTREAAGTQLESLERYISLHRTIIRRY